MLEREREREREEAKDMDKDYVNAGTRNAHCYAKACVA